MSETTTTNQATESNNNNEDLNDNNPNVTTTMGTQIHDDGVSKEEAPVFHPIPLPLGDDSDDDSDDSDGGLPGSSQPKNIPGNSNRPIPVLEHAIRDCFQLAITTHDATSVDQIEKAVWHWEENAVIPTVDLKKEQEAIRSWMPRPLFLPTWAVQEDGGINE